MPEYKPSRNRTVGPTEAQGAAGDVHQITGTLAVAGAISSSAGISPLGSGANSVQVGNGAIIAGGAGSVAVGLNANASADGAVAIGELTTGSSLNATAFGNNAKATGVYSVAMGYYSQAPTSTALAVGIQAQINAGMSTIALGYCNRVHGDAAIAIGKFASSSADSAIAIGEWATGSATNAIAIGQLASSSLADTVVLGKQNVLQLNNVTSSAVHTPNKSALIYALTGEMYVKDMAGNATKISPHNENGEWEHYSVNSTTGKVVRINMEKAIRRLEHITGETFIEDE